MTSAQHGTWTRSFGNLAAGEVLTSALRILALLMVARRLGPAAFGTVSVGFIVGGYLIHLAHPGVEVAGMRRIAVDSEDARGLLSRLVGLRLLLAAAAYPVAVGFTVVLPIDRDTSILIVIFGLLIFTQALDVRWAFVGVQRTAAVATSSVAGAVLYFVAIGLLVHDSADLFIVAVAHVTAQAFIALTLLVASRRMFGAWLPDLRRRTGRKSTLVESIPFTLGIMLRSATVSIDVIFVKAFQPADEAGYYAAASRLMTVGLVYIGLYYGALLPTLVRTSRGPRGEFESVLRNGVLRALVLGGAIAIAGILAAPWIVPLVLGEQYAGSVVLLQILIVALFLIGINGLVNMSLIAFDRRRTYTKVMSIGLVVNVLANMVLIPAIGVVGAAVATVVSEAAVLVVAAFALSSAMTERQPTVSEVAQ